MALGTYMTASLLKMIKFHLLKEEEWHQKSWRKEHRKSIICAYKLSEKDMSILYGSTSNGPMKSLDVFYKWNEEGICTQIKSQTETQRENLKQEHEITFSFSHAATKTAWRPRDIWRGTWVPVQTTSSKGPVLDMRVKRTNQNEQFDSSFICETIVIDVLFIFHVLKITSRYYFPLD